MQYSPRVPFFSLLLCVFLLSSCAQRQDVPELDYVASLPPSQSGIPAQISEAFSSKSSTEQTGAHLVTSNREALLLRLALVDQATTSIDLQYFVWSSDTAGGLFYDRVMRAAERGVRVRILVDDIDIRASDAELATMGDHPFVDLRIFNPSRARNLAGQIGEWAINFRELNRRMHNKLMVVDGRIAIVGGRNIGNHYFGLEQDYNFVDMDLLVTGAILPELTQAYDQYWNNELSIPSWTLTDERFEGGLEAMRQQDQQWIDELRQYWVAYRTSPDDTAKILTTIHEKLIPIQSVFLQEKPQALNGDEYRLLDLIDHLARPSSEELLISSPYLIPQRDMLDGFTELTADGVDVKIITNSLGSNNHVAAHSHYKKFRRDLLNTGLELYEFNYYPSQELTEYTNVTPIEGQFISLHTKAIVSDREICFIGSLNLDPRAVEINTENGLLIKSDELCGQLAYNLEILMLPKNSWQVRDNEKGQMRWYGAGGNDGEKRDERSLQPARESSNRIKAFFFRLLPLENQL